MFLIAVSLCTCRHSNEEFILMSHRSHRFTQISSLQATVVTMPHSNRYFSARELRIFFRNTNCTNYTNKLLSLERFVFNTQYYSFKSHTDLTDLTDFFRCKQRFVYHQDCVSTIFQVVTPISFFEKCYICSPSQYRSALVVARMGEFILSNVPQISLSTQIFKIYQTIPNLFFSLLVRVSVVLSTSKMPWRSWEVKVPKYSPSINFFNGIEKSMPQSTKLSYFKNSG